MSKRVNVYVDGLNFYNGLKAAGWKKYYWLDLVSFFSKLLKPYQTLQGIDYFSCIPSEKSKETRQNQFFLANKIDPRFKVHLGTLQKTIVKCNQCRSSRFNFTEKESDVRMASRMIADVVNNKCDMSILVSGDRDFIPSIETIHELRSNHKVFVFMPPYRTSPYLKTAGNRCLNLAKHEQKFTTSLLPKELIVNGTLVQQPPQWS
jgi:uncharacterized LabA/DUF88 family protein